jgi:hypothetical protein
MKASLGLLVLVPVLAACSKKPDSPRLEFGDVGFVLHLPTAMQRALDSLAPGFKIVRTDKFRSDVPQLAAQDAGTMQALFATIADFDGDGTLDAVEEGTVPGDTALHVVAIMNGTAPRAMNVVRYPLWDADAVGLYISVPKGTKAGTFEVVDYPDSSTVYRYAGGAFVGTKIGS